MSHTDSGGGAGDAHGECYCGGGHHSDEIGDEALVETCVARDCGVTCYCSATCYCSSGMQPPRHTRPSPHTLCALVPQHLRSSVHHTLVPAPHM